MALGLCTYLWGRDWDLPTLIRNCETAGVLGVELRSEHAHGVEPSLDKAQRDAVKQRFADSPVKLVSLGSNERFDNPDPAKLKASMEKAKAFVVLSHDVGSSGVKVKPDSFHKDVPHEQTIEQIGRSLNELGEFAAGYGQQIRLEVHGQCAELPTIKAILDIATHKNVGICWNSNAQDLKGDGLEYNFNLVRKRFGETIHVRPLDDKSYPYQQFIDLLVKTDYRGWVLIEAHADPQDRVAALAEQQKLFKEMVAAAQAKL
jgi:sugar phosphate isomerase/epimerase